KILFIEFNGGQTTRLVGLRRSLTGTQTLIRIMCVQLGDPTMRHAAIVLAAVSSLSLLGVDAAMADCGLDHFNCRSDCTLNPFSTPNLVLGLAGPGAMSGIAATNCEIKCDDKYRVCENAEREQAARKESVKNPACLVHFKQQAKDQNGHWIDKYDTRT